MIVTLRNIGSIKEAKINLDKDFTIFIGPNNTGKTYASYCLYGLKKINSRLLPNSVINTLFDIDFNQLISKGALEINLLEIFSTENLKKLSEAYSLVYRNFLPQLFGLAKSNFENSHVELDLKEQSENFEQFLKDFHFSLFKYRRVNMEVEFDKPSNSTSLNLSFQQIEYGDKRDQIETDNEGLILAIKRAIIENTFQPFINYSNIVFLPAERLGISVFSKDLLIDRFKKSNELLVSDLSDDDSSGFNNSDFNQYSLVIQDAVSNYSTVTKKRKVDLGKDLLDLADELEEKVLKGKIVVNEDGDVFYEKNDIPINIQASGSIIKSLANLILYLRYGATRFDILIIDEPEINLHPDNQRLIARILAKISNLGIKIIVSTHSDYFIRELNNLIMLSKEHEEVEKLKKKYGYSDDELLNYKKFGIYLFKDGIAQNLEVTETGMPAATIDEEINKLNNTANEIYWTLFEE